MSEAKTFAYVSNAPDGNIDAFLMDTTTGALVDWQGRGRQDGHADRDPKISLRRRTLAADARVDLRH